MAIAIIGGGVIGLSTGIKLQKSGISTKIYTKDLPKDTDSRAACAIWLPFSGGPKMTIPEEEKRWVRESWATFEDLYETKAETCGIKKVELVECLDEEVQEPYFADIVDEFKSDSIEGPDGKIDCWRISTFIVEMPKYLPYLRRRFEELGGEIVQQEISRETISQLPESTIFNCTGMGAKELFGDDALHPVKGEVLLHEQVDIDKAIGDGKFCIIPRSDSLVIGSQWDEGTVRRTHDEEWADTTLETADEWANSPMGRQLGLDEKYDVDKVTDSVVGIRPTRDHVRLERQQIDGKLVYHNYGHGGSGITLSWGCVKDLVQRYIDDTVGILNDINPARSGRNHADVSVEIAHVDRELDDDNFEEVVSKSVERVRIVTEEFESGNVEYSVSVLIDDNNLDADGEYILDRIVDEVGNDIRIDYACYESELESVLEDLEGVISDKTMSRIHGYIGDNGETACSHDILIWYCLRLGLMDEKPDVTIPLSDRAKAGDVPFTADKNLSILKQGVAEYEHWATEYLEESFPPEVAAACNKIFYDTN